MAKNSPEKPVSKAFGFVILIPELQKQAFSNSRLQHEHPVHKGTKLIWHWRTVTIYVDVKVYFNWTYFILVFAIFYKTSHGDFYQKWFMETPFNSSPWMARQMLNPLWLQSNSLLQVGQEQPAVRDVLFLLFRRGTRICPQRITNQKNKTLVKAFGGQCYLVLHCNLHEGACVYIATVVQWP